MENNLEKILKEKGLQKGELAEKVGVHRNTIARIIKGADPHLNLAHKIAKALGKSIYEIWKLK